MVEQFQIYPELSELLPDLPADTIVSRTYFENAVLKAILFGIAEGQTLSEHTSSQHAVLHFLQGEAELVLGSETHTARPGTWVHLAPHLPHSISARTRTVMILLLLKGSS
jgi:quercetin dioxygenase-like cupin family protein